MPAITHDTEDSLEASWAQLGHQVAPCNEPELDDIRQCQYRLLALSDEVASARKSVTLRREIILTAIQAGLNPGDIPEQVFEEDKDFERRRRWASDFGYTPRPEQSTKLGQDILQIALRLPTTNRVITAEALTNLARRLR